MGFKPAPASEELAWATLTSPGWTIWSTARATMQGRAYDFAQHYVRRARARLEALAEAGLVNEVRSKRGRVAYKL